MAYFFLFKGIMAIDLYAHESIFFPRGPHQQIEDHDSPYELSLHIGRLGLQILFFGCTGFAVAKHLGNRNLLISTLAVATMGLTCVIYSVIHAIGYTDITTTLQKRNPTYLRGAKWH